MVAQTAFLDVCRCCVVMEEGLRYLPLSRGFGLCCQMIVPLQGKVWTASNPVALSAANIVSVGLGSAFSSHTASEYK